MKTIRLTALAGALLAIAAAAPAQTPEENLARLGLTLPAVPPAIANYVPAVRSGHLVFLAGQIARGPDGKVIALRASDGVARFDADTGEHYHLECTVCGRVMDACPTRDRRKNVDFADKSIERATGFRVTGHRLTYLGVCSECKNARIPRDLVP